LNQGRSAPVKSQLAQERPRVAGIAWHDGRSRPALRRSHVPETRPSGTFSQRDRDLILSVGRLERYKGHQRAIEALPELLKHRPGVHLRIAGGGPYANQLQALARRLRLASRVEIGAIPPSDRSGMADLMVRAGVVVLLSDYEAQPLAVMEALALGRPVVATDATGLHEFVVRGLAHGVSPRASPKEVARAILQALDAPAMTPLRLPTWDDCAARVLEVYRSIENRIGFLTG
jgi:glycogen synthase